MIAVQSDESGPGLLMAIADTNSGQIEAMVSITIE